MSKFENEKIPLFLVGDLPETSVFFQQLRIRSAFDLIMKGKKYFAFPETDLPETDAVTRVFKILHGPTSSTIGEVIKTLDRSLPDWRAFDRIVIYPARVIPTDPKALDFFLSGLAIGRSELAWNINGQLLYAGSPKAILQASHQLSISDVVDCEKSPLPFQFRDLGLPQPISSISNISTEPRDFNSLRVSFPYIVKRSQNQTKMREEYRFFQELPMPVRGFFPQVGLFAEGGGACEYEIEWVPLLDLGRFLIHGALGREVIEKLLESLGLYFSRCPKRAVGPEELRRNCQNLFVEKTRERLLQLKKLPEYPRFEQIILHSQGFDFSRFAEDTLNAVEREINKTVTKDEYLWFSHGDLCFSNMLFDRNTGILKFIDPKGSSFTELPLLYDLAKLSHSAFGKYDLIINDKMTATVNEQLEIVTTATDFSPNYFQELERRFGKFLSQWGYSLDTIRVMESALFLSMIPLHRDRMDRMLFQAGAARKAIEASGHGAQ